MITRRRALCATLVLAATGATSHAQEVEYIKPMAGPIIRHFEPPPTPYAAGHRGIDVAAPVGTDVLASAGGSVAFAGQVGGELFVSIDHADGLRTTYSFLSLVLVKAGATVAQGDRIALSGRGHAGSEADHLHFGVRRGDVYLDPEPLLLKSLRNNLWRVVRLVPIPPEPTAA